MDSNQTPVDATKTPSTHTPLNSSTPPTSTQPQASLESSAATTTDVVIDYDIAEEETRLFMAVRLLSLLLLSLLSPSPPRTDTLQCPPTVGQARG